MLDDNIIKAFTTMLVSVGALALLFFLLKKFAMKTKSKNDPTGLQVISKISLRPKTNLFVVRAGEKTLLIGATDHNINTLADLSDEQAADIGSEITKLDKQGKLPAPPPEITDSSLSFRNFIKNTFKRSN